jgi:hypothetical protein
MRDFFMLIVLSGIDQCLYIIIRNCTQIPS